MPLFELDETAEQFDIEEQRRLDELFPVIEASTVKAQVISWDGPVPSKKGTDQIVYDLSVVEDPTYSGARLKYYAPLSGRGKNFTKRLVLACGVPWTGKGHDPEQLMGKIVRLSLSVDVDDASGRKRTQIDAVSAV
jgi:hypothetical protein